MLLAGIRKLALNCVCISRKNESCTIKIIFNINSSTCLFCFPDTEYMQMLVFKMTPICHIRRRVEVKISRGGLVEKQYRVHCLLLAVTELPSSANPLIRDTSHKIKQHCI